MPPPAPWPSASTSARRRVGGVPGDAGLAGRCLDGLAHACVTAAIRATRARRRAASRVRRRGRQNSVPSSGAGQLLQQLRPVVADVADRGRRPGRRASARAGGGASSAAQLLRVRAGRVQPGVPAVRRSASAASGGGCRPATAGPSRRGHGQRRRLRLGGDHRAGHPPGLRVVVGQRPVPPELVQPGHREDRAVRRASRSTAACAAASSCPPPPAAARPSPVTHS